MSKNINFIKNALEDLESEYQNLIYERDINNMPIKLYKLFHKLENKSNNIYYNYETANNPKNKPMNRYYNVLPNEETRFVSKNLSYINANIIKNKYILTQGPMRAYMKEFWTMVWDSKADTIICLANQIENSKKKFDSYYNDNREQNYHEFNVQVQTVEKNNLHNVVTRKIQVIKTFYEFRPRYKNSSDIVIVETGKEMRIIKQIHYIGWPDNGMPASADDILHIISQINNSANTPTIVHCSAGIGRSGTFIVIKEILDKIYSILNGSEMDFHYKINISDLIFELRGYRQGLVQNVHQFNFCYSAVIVGIKSILNKSNNNSFIN